MPLHLTRHPGESLTLTTALGEVIVIGVETIQRGQVKLSLDAPASVVIHRTESAEKARTLEEEGQCS